MHLNPVHFAAIDRTVIGKVFDTILDGEFPVEDIQQVCHVCVRVLTEGHESSRFIGLLVVFISSFSVPGRTPCDQAKKNILWLILSTRNRGLSK